MSTTPPAPATPATVGASATPASPVSLEHPGSPLAATLLAGLWASLELPATALARARLSGQEPALPSSWPLGSLLQATLAAAGLAGSELLARRGGPALPVDVDLLEAVHESTGRFALDGAEPPAWDPLSGLYRCRDGPAGARGDTRRWVRVHANFAHHRDGVLALLGLPTGPQTPRSALEAVLAGWDAQAFEEAAAVQGLVVARVREPAEWQAHPQAAAVAASPLVALHRTGDAAPRPWPLLRPPAPGSAWQPLDGLRVLELTRILAGPVAGRTLAAQGADVLLVNGPHLPNIAALADTSRGKRSALVDLRTDAGRDTLRHLAAGADVVLQGYRPGALAGQGVGPRELGLACPGLVTVSLSAYGPDGPWSSRRGFDSLVQSATGLNIAEATAFGAAQPRALPLQALDFSAGYLLAFGAIAGLLRQREQGGRWHVEVSLARVAQAVMALPPQVPPDAAKPLDLDASLETQTSGFGQLRAVRHAVRLGGQRLATRRPSMPPGSHPAAWDTPPMGD